MIKPWIMFTFPVLEKIFVIFCTTQLRNIICGFFWHAKTYTFIKICDVLGKTFDYKSKNQISGSALWILDKSLNLFGLGFRLLLWKNEVDDQWFSTLPLCTFTQLFYKIPMHRQYPRTMKSKLPRVGPIYQNCCSSPSDPNRQRTLKTTEKRMRCV